MSGRQVSRPLRLASINISIWCHGRKSQRGIDARLLGTRKSTIPQSHWLSLNFRKYNPYEKALPASI